jgi:protein-S-isoprenylcysteine O-methyltransferase Ste14
MLPRAVTLEIVRGVWLALGLVWGVAYFNTKRTEVRQPRGSLAAYGLLLMVSFALLAGILPLGDTRLLQQRPELTGLMMVIAGAGLAIWSRLVLARNWSGAITLKTDHELVERGPYRFVRHPIYAGLILMFLGTALVRGTMLAFGALIMFSLLHGWKLRAEESLLAQRFPDVFGAYKARTKALVPLVF